MDNWHKIHNSIALNGCLPVDSDEIKANLKFRAQKAKKLKEMKLSRKWVKYQEDRSGSMRYERGIERPKKLGREASVAQILDTMNLFSLPPC